MMKKPFRKCSFGQMDLYYVFESEGGLYNYSAERRDPLMFLAYMLRSHKDDPSRAEDKILFFEAANNDHIYRAMERRENPDPFDWERESVK